MHRLLAAVAVLGASALLASEAQAVDPVPGPPTLGLTPKPSEGRVEFVLGPTVGETTADAFEVQRLANGSGVWQPVKTADGDGRVPADNLLDDFDRGMLGPDWVLQEGDPFAIEGGQIRSAGTFSAMSWAAPSATPEMHYTLAVEPAVDNHYTYLNLFDGADSAAPSGYAVEFDDNYIDVFRVTDGDYLRLPRTGEPSYDPDHFRDGEKVGVAVEADHIAVYRKRRGPWDEIARVTDTEHRFAEWYLNVGFSDQTVVRIDDFGGRFTDWENIGSDYEAPIGNVTYRARAVHVGPGGESHSAWVEKSTVLEGDPAIDEDPAIDDDRPGDADVTAPDTRITTQPNRKLKARGGNGARATFRFAGTDNVTPPGTLAFECKIDRPPFEACVSPFKVKLKKGRHTIAVRAIDRAGNVDATPAKSTMRVRKKKARKRRGSTWAPQDSRPRAFRR